MATTTPYYGATLPDGTDRADVNVLNDNTTLWDLELHNESVRASANIANIYDATATYTVGDFCTYLGVLYKCTTDTASPAGAFDSTEWTQVNVTDEAVSWSSNGVLGAKNLNSYPYYHTTRSSNGIDWTDNGDGTWTAQGTATSNSSVYCHNRTHPSERELFLPNGDYRLSGCPSGGSSSTYSINVDITIDDGNSNIARDYGEGATFSISGDDYSNKGAYVRVSCIVFNGYAIANTLTYMPMIRRIEDTDDTYQPYAMTNKELTDVVNNVPTTAGTYTLQAVRNADNTITYSWV